MTTTFKQFLLANEEKLDMYTTAIAKVHSRLHPEVHEVKALYDELLTKVKQDDATDLTPLFDQLTQVTSDYRIPADTCQTYEAVYQDLQTADSMYRAERVA